MAAQMEMIDVSQIVEEEDHTNLQGELACSGGACEVTEVSSGEEEEETFEEAQTFEFAALSV
jgi:hypothetical protein